MTLSLIARDMGGRSDRLRDPLLVDDGRGARALAIFGHEEEAEMFLGIWVPGDGWEAREVGAGELASLVRRPFWPGVRCVALDPLLGALAEAARFDLPVHLDRDRFAERLARYARDTVQG